MDFCQAWNMQLISIETKVEDDMIFDTLAKGGQFKIHQKSSYEIAAMKWPDWLYELNDRLRGSSVLDIRFRCGERRLVEVDGHWQESDLHQLETRWTQQPERQPALPSLGSSGSGLVGPAQLRQRFVHLRILKRCKSSWKMTNQDVQLWWPIVYYIRLYYKFIVQ